MSKSRIVALRGAAHPARITRAPFISLPIGDKTEVKLVMDYDPAEIGDDRDKVRDAVNGRIDKNLEGFREFIERPRP
jgi:hypothetical protein